MAVLTFRYGDVERAVAHALGTKPSPILTARLRRFRKLGLLGSGDTPGSGYRLEYEAPHVLRLAIALYLQSIGQPPRHCVLLSGTAMGQSHHFESDENGDTYILVWPSLAHPGLTFAFGDQQLLQLLERLKRAEVALAVLNASLLTRRLAEGLRNAGDG